ncbi:MAG: hypothetical protein WDZ35_13975 [Crocinitomicaceae bacterium]
MLYEHDYCRSWHESGVVGREGFWMIEVIRFYKGDWYLFEPGHNYVSPDDQPVRLKDHLKEIELYESTRSSI